MNREYNGALRAARGDLTQGQLADLVNAEIARTDRRGKPGGVTDKSVGRWEAGRTTWPVRQTRDALCAVLGVDDPADVGLYNRKALGRGRVDDALARPALVDERVVNELDRRVRDLALAYDHAPSVSLLADAGEVHGQVVYLSSEARSAEVGRQLRVLEAESAILMGQLVWDASQRSDQVRPLRYFDSSIAAATAVGNPIAVAHAQLRKSYVALYGTRDARHGLALAREAANLSRRTSRALSAIAILHVGEAHAMLGDYAACERALLQGERLLDRVTDHDPAAGFVSPQQHGRLAGSCYLSLDNPRRAEPVLQLVADQLQHRDKSRAIALGNLTLAYARQGKIDEATGALDEAIGVIEATRGGGGFTVVFAAARELRPWRHEAIVRDVYDRLLTLLAA